MRTALLSHQGVDDENGPNKIDGNFHEGEAVTSHYFLQHWTNEKTKFDLMNKPCADRDAVTVTSYCSGYLMSTRTFYKDSIWDLMIPPKSR